MNILVVYSFTNKNGRDGLGRATCDIAGDKPTYEEIKSIEDSIQNKSGHDSIIVVNVIPLAD